MPKINNKNTRTTPMASENFMLSNEEHDISEEHIFQETSDWLFLENIVSLVFHRLFILWTRLNDTQKQPSQVFCEKGILRNFTKLTGKHLCQSLFFNKIAGLSPATLLKKRLWHRRFPVSFVKFPRKPFLQYTSVRLLLDTIGRYFE